MATLIQSVYFDRIIWDKRKARTWLRHHGYRHKGKCRKTKKYINIEMWKSKLFVEDSFRLVQFKYALVQFKVGTMLPVSNN